MIPTIAANTVVDIYNPNCIMEEVWWNFLVIEKKVIKILSDLAWFDYNTSDWMAVFSWTATLLNAIKISIWKFSNDVINNGIKEDYYILTWETNHHVITSICWFLWIWTNKCIRIKSIEEWKMDLDDFYKKYLSLIKNDKKVVCVIANGWETINHALDDLSDIDIIVKKFIKKYNIKKPHIHLDTVNWRVWLFFKDYNFIKNSLQIHQEDLNKIKYNFSILNKLKYADSFWADFHKTWLCAYNSAFFVVKNYKKLSYINWSENIPHKDKIIWEMANFDYSIEHSRSWKWIASAYIALHTMWYDWFRSYLVYLMQLGRILSNIIKYEYKNHFEIINFKTNRFVSLIVPIFSNNQKSFNNLKNWEDCEKTIDYFENNISGSINLFSCMEKYDVKKLIFSSSATVYDQDIFIQKGFDGAKETDKTWNTSNPYWTTKYIIEQMLQDLAKFLKFDIINLRYFNPIWAHKSWYIWEDPNGIPNNLLPFIMKVASWELKQLQVFGDDYDTHDGTWKRDYIDVNDLINWHIKAYKLIENNNTWTLKTYNLWTWKSVSVLDMLQTAKEVTWKEIPYKIAPRREWDLADVYCNPKIAEKEIYWKANISLEESLKNAWRFYSK